MSTRDQRVTLYRRYGPLVYRRALKILGNAAEAEEATQEIFIRAFKGIDKFDERSKLSTWLFRITTNYCLNSIRDRARRRDLWVVIAYIGPRANSLHFPSTTLPDGFSLLQTPIRCLTRVTGRFDCPSLVGEACTVDADCCPNGDCDGAVCYTEESAGRPVPGGYCAFREASNQCDLLGPGEESTRTLAHRVVAFRRDTLFRACGADADCRPGYFCEAAQRVCFPKGVVQLVLEDGYAPDSICRECPAHEECADNVRRRDSADGGGRR